MIQANCSYCIRVDNPPCCNPLHLEAGTQKKNIRDCIKRGRANHAFGEDAGLAVLTDEKVIEIRSLYPQVNQHEIARKFGVSAKTIQMITSGQTWRHLPIREHSRRESLLGDNNHKAKLTWELVREIRRQYAESGKVFGFKAMIARRYDMDKSTICDLLNGRTWIE